MDQRVPDVSLAEIPGATAASRWLDSRRRAELDLAVRADETGSGVYRSLRNLGEVIGGEYGDRVLFELVQNAHDAHQAGDEGEILIRLVLDAPHAATLYVANRGRGFSEQNVESIRNLATSSKGIGEGIGNKGLGFRSVEALSTDPRIYSQSEPTPAERFGGFCFRFAREEEVERELLASECEPCRARRVASSVPRYLLPVPLPDQPPEVRSLAELGYATVVALPMSDKAAVDLARRQVKAMMAEHAPLLLFLDRIHTMTIEAREENAETHAVRMTRRATSLGIAPPLGGDRIERVVLDLGGEERGFALIRRTVDKGRVVAAVRASIARQPQLGRWVDWVGDPVVSAAVPLEGSGKAGRLYNFLPMAADATSPCAAHLDAPFYSDLSRRRLDQSLPLNKLLLDALAETCLAAAVALAREPGEIPRTVPFDLAAWIPVSDHSLRLHAAFRTAGTELSRATIVPTGEGANLGWASLPDVLLWPDVRTRIMTPVRLARLFPSRVASGLLGADRSKRLEALQTPSIRQSLLPRQSDLTAWVAAVVKDLFQPEARLRDWEQLYDDIPALFAACQVPLENLSEIEAFPDRSGKLRRGGSKSRPPLFVSTRGDHGPTRRRMPSPPQSLSRVLPMLRDDIAVGADTLAAFAKARLWRAFDPIEILRELDPFVNGAGATEARKRDALEWAFRVWRADPERATGALPKAGLHVPTLGGWSRADAAAFPAAWNSRAARLETYLLATRHLSADCEAAYQAVLRPPADWPVSVGANDTHWRRFLEIVGVTTDLRPCPSVAPTKGTPAWVWHTLFRDGTGGDAAFSPEWRALARTDLPNPYTEYQRRGEAWRFPGQLEFGSLPAEAKEILSGLLLRLLTTGADRFLDFWVGRYDRDSSAWNQRRLPTPLAAFLRTAPWLLTETRQGRKLARPDTVWGGRLGASPPRLVPQVAADLAGQIENDSALRGLMFGGWVGLRDWPSDRLAAERLHSLANEAADLAQHERADFRREYRTAWHRACEELTALPADVPLAVSRGDGIDRLDGGTSAPVKVHVAPDAVSAEANLLVLAGNPVLHVGDAPLAKVMELVRSTGRFDPVGVDATAVRLLADGKPFVPGSTDPLLASGDLGWLADAAVLAHGVRADALERQVQIQRVVGRLGRIRFRSCDRIELVVGEGDSASKSDLRAHACEDDEHPTILVRGVATISWRELADIARYLNPLLDRRLRSFESLLAHLALQLQGTTLAEPSEGAYAEALSCDLATVQEHLAATRSGQERLLAMLLPAVSCLLGRAAADALKAEAGEFRSSAAFREWLALRLPSGGPTADDVLRAARTNDPASMRRQLDLGFEEFNASISAFGGSPISNEAVLRSVFEATLHALRGSLVEVVRRAYLPAFRAGRSLSGYLRDRSLSFITFDDDWIRTREDLDEATAAARIYGLLDARVGNILPTGMADGLERTRRDNQRTVEKAARTLRPAVLAWCAKRGVEPPEPWLSQKPMALAVALNAAGLIDFEPLAEERVPGFCARARVWPTGMAETGDPAAHGLGAEDLAREAAALLARRNAAAVAARSVPFAGTSLDTADPEFAARFAELAERQMSASPVKGPLNRVAALETLGPSGRTAGGGSGGGGRKRAMPRLSDTMRDAIGFAGECVAFHWLCRRHLNLFGPGNWVSENRRFLHTDDPGDDRLGYDFRLVTRETEWLYEVKASMEEPFEFEMTQNELEVAAQAAPDTRRRYRILYVTHVFDPSRWNLLMLPNPVGRATKDHFQVIGRGTVRMRFERRSAARQNPST